MYPDFMTHRYSEGYHRLPHFSHMEFRFEEEEWHFILNDINFVTYWTKREAVSKLD